MSTARRLRLSPTRGTEDATAHGIYGIIVSAAVMAASHAHRAVAVVAAVLVTLVIYWSAERFSRIVATRVHADRPLTWRQARRQLAAGWEIVTATALPLLVLSGLRLLGVSLDAAVFAALACSTLLLGLAGWDLGRNGRLTSLERLAAASLTGMFGALLIVLKTLLH
jgi:hypothetical protein